MKFLSIVAMLCLLMLSAAPDAANPDEQASYDYEGYLHQFNLLHHYRLMYSKEERIFDYCLKKFTREHKSSGRAPSPGYTIGTTVGICMRDQIELKDRILGHAQDQLGGRTLAQGIYDECVEYYPTSGVARIGECVRTRLILDSMLEDDIIEQKIYQNCDYFWRKHGSAAIDNCSRNDANYYRHKGELRD